MAIDEALLERHGRRRDDLGGISETFVQPRLGSGMTVGVVSRPLGMAQPLGWVICHSFAMEQIHLGRMEVGLARAISAAGFPVLRYHGQGYGDSELGMRHADLSSHVADARDAVALMAGLEGVEQVGVLGARFGGLVAGFVADEGDLPFMALVEPVTRGAQYMRDFLRTQVFFDLVGTSDNGGSPGMEKLREAIASRGWADIRGFKLSAQAYEEISGVSLLERMRRFHGSSFVLGVSRTDRFAPGLQALTDVLRQMGGDVEQGVVQDRLASNFGQHHHRNDAGNRKTDIQFGLYQEVTSKVAAWIGRRIVPADPAREAPG